METIINFLIKSVQLICNYRNIQKFQLKNITIILIFLSIGILNLSALWGKEIPKAIDYNNLSSQLDHWVDDEIVYIPLIDFSIPAHQLGWRVNPWKSSGARQVSFSFKENNHKKFNKVLHISAENKTSFTATNGKLFSSLKNKILQSKADGFYLWIKKSLTSGTITFEYVLRDPESKIIRFNTKILFCS